MNSSIPGYTLNIVTTHPRIGRMNKKCGKCCCSTVRSLVSMLDSRFSMTMTKDPYISYCVIYPIGSMYGIYPIRSSRMVYMLTKLGYIDGTWYTIYGIHTDLSWVWIPGVHEWLLIAWKFILSYYIPRCPRFNAPVFSQNITLQKCRVLSYAVQANKHGLTGHHRV